MSEFRLQWALFFVIGCLLILTACSSSPTQVSTEESTEAPTETEEPTLVPTATEEAQPNAGHWQGRGTGMNVENISFTLTEDGTITDITFSVRRASGASCNVFSIGDVQEARLNEPFTINQWSVSSTSRVYY